MPVLFWNRSYDRPRLRKAIGEPVLPIDSTYDAMDAFHVAYNALPRKLGFATACLPSGAGIEMWKHLSQLEPARYSAIDSIVLLRNWLDTQNILRSTGAEPVYRVACL